MKKLDLRKAEKSFLNYRQGLDEPIGKTYLIGRYVVMLCENELDSLETFHWFQQAEQAARREES